LTGSAVQILEAQRRPANKNAPVFKTTKESFTQSWKRAVIGARTGYLHQLLKVELDQKGIDGESQIRALVFKKKEPSPTAFEKHQRNEINRLRRHESYTRMQQQLTASA
jgi:hypothetical protein